MNKKMTAVIRREYVTRAKTKGFVIGTLLFPVIVGLILGGVFLFMMVFKPSTKTYALVDHSGKIGPVFQSMLDDTLSSGQPKHRILLIEAAIPLDSLQENLLNQVRAKKIDGYLVIPSNILESREVVFSARNVSDFEEQGDFSDALSYIVGNLRLENRGLPAADIRREMSQSRVRLNSRQVTEQGEIEKSAASSFILAYILTYMMLLLMMGYGQTLMRSVVEEKSQRITETIIASIRPRDLLLGKMIGISALGLTQLFVVGVIMMLLAQFIHPVLLSLGVQSPGLMEVIRQIHFSAPLFGFMIVFFLLGYFFFSGLFAGIGAMVNTEDEGQQYQMPIIFLILIGYFMMFTIARHPDTPMAFWTSLIPVFTPMVMFARIAVSDPVLPSGTFISLGVMILANFCLLRIITRIYRVGILMYGKKPSFRETIKWIRYK